MVEKIRILIGTKCLFFLYLCLPIFSNSSLLFVFSSSSLFFKKILRSELLKHGCSRKSIRAPSEPRLFRLRLTVDFLLLRTLMSLSSFNLSSLDLSRFKEESRDKHISRLLFNSVKFSSFSLEIDWRKWPKANVGFSSIIWSAYFKDFSWCPEKWLSK